MFILLDVLLACHNRRNTTATCLKSLIDQKLPPNVKLRIILVDDGSNDGTSEMVTDMFPDVFLVRGNGNLYWTGGMSLAMNVAGDQADYFLLLNDDTHLYPDAITNLIQSSNNLTGQGIKTPIIIGATESPDGSGLSYGGLHCNSKFNSLYLEKVIPQKSPVLCDTFNGNCVLFPVAAKILIGGLDQNFTHSMGDIDLGLRAKKYGIKSYMSPGYVGTCIPNNGDGLWTDKTLPIAERWKQIIGPKGLPPREWFVMTRRYAGPFWPLFWVNPYLKFFLCFLKSKCSLE